MRPHRVIVTAAAEKDLQEIYDYIAESDSIERADNIVARLEQTITKLNVLPNRGAHPRELLDMGNRSYRETYFKPYRIVYRVQARNVIVHLVADGRRDMQALLARRLLGD